MKETFYSYATRENAIEQSSKKIRSLRTTRDEDAFEPISRDNIKAWLVSNALHAPISTPETLKDSVRKLETILGKPHGTEDSNDFARVSTVRLKTGSSTSGPVRRTSYKYEERYDYSVQERDHTPLVNNVCANIITEFLHITGYGHLVQTIIEAGHRVYGHVDWYPDRTYKAQTWHKDSRGATLFVGLIYMNNGEIQGPDVIENPWPLSEEMESKRTPKCMLPSWILGPIDEILKENAKEKMRIRQTGKIPAGGGMIWFIDELIHHRTPQNGPGLGKFEDSRNLAISEITLGTLPKDDFSMEGTWVRFNSGGTKRQFVRIWITLDEFQKQDF
jgi:hypothetical protein